MQKEYIKKLQETITNKQPIDIYTTDDNKFYDTFYYNEEKNIYQGQFGFLDMKSISQVIIGELDHLEIKVHNVRWTRL